MEYTEQEDYKFYDGLREETEGSFSQATIFSVIAIVLALASFGFFVASTKGFELGAIIGWFCFLITCGVFLRALISIKEYRKNYRLENKEIWNVKEGNRDTERLRCWHEWKSRNKWYGVFIDGVVVGTFIVWMLLVLAYERIFVEGASDFLSGGIFLSLAYIFALGLSFNLFLSVIYHFLAKHSKSKMDALYRKE